MATPPTAPLFRPHGRGLPALTSWQHRPLLARVAPEVPKQCEGGQNLQINPRRSTPFETELFSGEVVFRVREIEGGLVDPWAPGGVYNGKKRMLGVVIQGKFKRRVSYSDVKAGFRFPKQITVGFLTKTALAAIKVAQSGVEYDVNNTPNHLTNLLISSCDTLTISPPGEKPPCPVNTLPVENTGWADKKARRVAMKQEVNKGKYYEPGTTYTFTFYSDKIDLIEFQARLPWPAPNLHIDQYTNGQCLPLEARLTTGEVLWRFEMWHESVLAKADKEVFEPMRGIIDLERSQMLSLHHTTSRRRLSRTVNSGMLGAVGEAAESEEGAGESQPEEGTVGERLHALRARVLNLTFDQSVTQAQMEAMVRSAQPLQEPVSLNPAHVKFKKIVQRALDRSMADAREERTVPFAEEETFHFLEALIAHTARGSGSPTSPAPTTPARRRAPRPAAPNTLQTRRDLFASAREEQTLVHIQARVRGNSVRRKVRLAPHSTRKAAATPAAGAAPPPDAGALQATLTAAAAGHAVDAVAQRNAHAGAVLKTAGGAHATRETLTAAAADHAIDAVAQRDAGAAQALRAAGGAKATPESLATAAVSEVGRRDPRAAAAIAASGGPQAVTAKATRITVC